jgi:hypothetical protein
MVIKKRIPLRHKYKELRTKLTASEREMERLKKQSEKDKSIWMWYFWAGFVSGVVFVEIIIYFT